MSAEAAARLNARQAKASVDCWVLEENWKAIQLLQATSTQWRYTTTGHTTGLHYEAVEVVIKRGGFEPFSQDDWQRFQTAERVAISELNQ